eukprot:345915_1
MFLFLAFICLLVGSVFSETTIAAPDFTINMDEPSNVRLKSMCDAYKEITQDIYQHFLIIFPELFVDDMEAIMLHWYNKNKREPYTSEIAYMANCTNIPLGAIVTINLFYDLTVFCTSIVAEDENGIIFHARNLDYGFLPLVRNITYNAHFTDNTGKILYSTTMWFGYAGVSTGVRPNGFSISMDERRDQGDPIDNIKAIRDDWYPPSWLIRDLIANNYRDGQVNNYKDALNALINTQIMAPVYFIIGGLKYPDGAVVTRNETYSFNLWSLETSYLGWYNVETNYDWWVPPPKRDDRRDPAIKNMNAMGQANLTAMGLYNVLSQTPVLDDGTIYTTIYSASNASLYYTMIRFPFK